MFQIIKFETNDFTHDILKDIFLKENVSLSPVDSNFTQIYYWMLNW